MTGIVILTILVLLCALGGWYGHDSRETLHSKEQELASYGMTWEEDPAYEQELANELGAALRQFWVSAVVSLDEAA